MPSYIFKMSAKNTLLQDHNLPSFFLFKIILTPITPIFLSFMKCKKQQEFRAVPSSSSYTDSESSEATAIVTCSQRLVVCAFNVLHLHFVSYKFILHNAIDLKHIKWQSKKYLIPRTETQITYPQLHQLIHHMLPVENPHCH